MSTEHLEIPECPKCNDGHRYKLDVERSIVMKMLTMEDIDERPRSVKITRLFTCPVKNEEFQAKFSLSDTSSDRIIDVTVIGVSHDGE